MRWFNNSLDWVDDVVVFQKVVCYKSASKLDLSNTSKRSTASREIISDEAVTVTISS